MRVRFQLWRRLGQATAVLAALVLGSVSVAGASALMPDLIAGTARVQETGTELGKAFQMTLPEVAGAVVAALSGGTSPSSVAKRGPGGDASSPSQTSPISAATGVAQAETLPTRPGWGCGDKNHTHTGPPGKGGEKPSPCNKNK